MRLEQINLDKYGHLNGLRIDLPARSPDLHILMGTNEAGKSTTQAALTDFLYGFEHTTNYAFLYDARDLRVGGVIGGGKESFEAWRRKARNNSLQGADGNPLDEALLRAALSGVDKETFVQQFSLNHLRLRSGGKAIVEAASDLGRMLFQAGAGLDWLGERLHELQEKSDGLFRPSGSKQTIGAALKQRENALKQRKQLSSTERAFKEVQSKARLTKTELGTLASKRSENSTERTRLERSRRVIPILRKLDQEGERLSAIGEVPSLATDIDERFSTACQSLEKASRNVDTAADELQKAQGAHDAIEVDEVVLGRENEVEMLMGTYQNRYVAAEEDLPKRVADLKLQESIIANRSRDVGRADMTADNIADHLPKKAQVSALRRLAGEQAKHAEAERTAEKGMKAASEDLLAAKRVVDDFGASPNLVPIREAIDDCLADPGLGTRIDLAQKKTTELRNSLGKRLSKMVPAVPDGLVRRDLPSATVVMQYANDLAGWDQSLERKRNELGQLERRSADFGRERDTLISTKGAVPAEQLFAARSRRDAGWALVRKRFIDSEDSDSAAEDEFCAGQPLPDAFSAAISNADAVADTRFEAAENSGKLAAKLTDLKGVNDKIETLSTSIESDEAQRAALVSRWQAAWVDSGIEPELPAAMTGWIRELEEIEAIQIDLQYGLNAVEKEQAIEARLRDALVAAIVTLGNPKPDNGESLQKVFKRAHDLRNDLEGRERDRAIAEKKVKELTAAEEKAIQSLADARDANAKWQTTWSEKLAEWSLPSDTDPTDVEPVLDAWDSIRTAHDKIEGEQGLRHRIQTMNDDQERFRTLLKQLLAAVASDLCDQPSLQAAQELGRRLKQAQANRNLQSAAATNAANRAGAHAEAKEGEDAARKSVERILVEIGADTIDAAKPVLERFKLRAQIEQALGGLRDTLRATGDGLAEDALRKECDGLEFDALDGLITNLQAEDDRVYAEVERLNGILGECSKELAVFMEASAAAADAAEEAERATTDVLRATERYIRLQATIAVLRYAIDRYRKENEAPLLRRASILFSRLTLEKYAQLEIDYDSGDRPQLWAREKDGAGSVPVDKLSDGAQDQLFLALRLAAIDEIVAKGTVVPFVADDLFVNFDDDRAAAGLKVLAELAGRTQVLFFSHHQHLLDLAAKHIPDQFNAVRLTSGNSQ